LSVDSVVDLESYSRAAILFIDGGEIVGTFIPGAALIATSLRHIEMDAGKLLRGRKLAWREIGLNRIKRLLEGFLMSDLARPVPQRRGRESISRYRKNRL
jgi:hypothetical protein